MRFTILRMIAAGSLSAFNAVPSPAIGPTRPAGGGSIQPARATPAPAPAPLPAQPALEKPGEPPAGRILPRGSLLNLSV
jgi:hypothetical protein